MDVLRAWVGELVALIILAAALELLVPEGRMRGYVRMATGLLVVLALLRPAFQLVTRQAGLDLADFTLPTAGRLPGMAEVRARAARFRAGGDELAAQQFRRQLAAAAADLAMAVPGVARAGVEVDLEPGPPGRPPAVALVRVQVLPAGPPVPPVAPVRIGGTGPPAAGPAGDAAPHAGDAAPHAGDAAPRGEGGPGPAGLAAAVRSAVAGGLGVPERRVQVYLGSQ